MTDLATRDRQTRLRSLASQMKKVERAMESASDSERSLLVHQQIKLKRERLRALAQGKSPSGSGAPSRSTVFKVDDISASIPMYLTVDEIDSLDDARSVIDRVAKKTDTNFLRLCDALEAGNTASSGQVTRAVATGNISTLENIIARRTSEPHFLQALLIRDAQRRTLKSTRRSYEKLREDAKLVKSNVTIDEVRTAARVALEEYERLAILQEYLGKYKSVTARASIRLEELLMARDIESGEANYYTANSLNKLRELGSYTSGSREWLESRQGGVGGSDVGSILKVDKEFAYSNYKEVFNSKVVPISDEQVDEQSGEDFMSYTGRGNAWEESILRSFIERHPELNVARCKTSWYNTERPFQYANFDGLLLDADGVPEGIVEIKTGSEPSKWGPVFNGSNDSEEWGPASDGIDGIPLQYRAQVLWYLHAAGLKKGVVVALLDDHEVREYHFTIDADLAQEQEDNLLAVQAFWNEVTAVRANPDAFLPAAKAWGIPRDALRSGWANKRTVVNNIAAYRDITPDELKAIFEADLPAPLRGDRDEVEAALKRLYTHFDPSTRKRPFIGLDIETSGFSASMGRIIELGISVLEQDGDSETGYKETKRISRLYGIPRKAREGKGTGFESVHHISVSDLDGKAPFSDPRNQAEILAVLCSGIVVAHNATYEDGWLRVHLDGYAEARAEGRIVLLDTMLITRHLFGEEMENHKLESLVKRYGREYEGAHRAVVDVDMMMRALLDLQQDVYELRYEN